MEPQDTGNPTGQPTSEFTNGNPTNAPDTGNQTGNPTQSDDARTFSQADVNKLMGQVRDDASATLLRKLGYEDLDALQGDVKTISEQREAAKTDLQREQEARQTLQSETEGLYERLFESEVRWSLRDSGVPSENVTDVMRLLDLDTVDVGNDGKITGLDEQVTALQGRLPALFEGQGTVVRRAPQLTGGNSPGGSNQNISEDAFNQRLRLMGLGGG